MSALGHSWSMRSGREQAMIAVLAVLIVAVLGWYGLARPLSHMADAAEVRAGLAAAKLAQVDDQSAALKAVAPRGSGDLEAVVAASAAAAHITLARQHREAAGDLAIGIDMADPPALFAWLRMLNDRDGVAVARLTATRAGESGVVVEALLTRP